ncbi:MAG: leucyl aminopeptidase [Bdellovibrionales bacterium]|nr:leucyl aminopeptidase [Bdellovibrionales bacterium]
MRIEIIKDSKKASNSDCLVQILTQKEIKEMLNAKERSPFKWFKKLPDGLYKSLVARLKLVNFDGNSSNFVTIDTCSNKAPFQLILIGTPEKYSDKFTELNSFRILGQKLYNHMNTLGFRSVEFNTHDHTSIDREKVQCFLQGISLQEYSFDKYRSNRPKSSAPHRVSLISKERDVTQSIKRLIAERDATFLARDLVNTPANDCTPAYLVKTAKQIAKDQRLKLTVYDKKGLQRIGAHSLLGVGRASTTPPYMIVLKYLGPKKSGKQIALVGKGVTFDSGGLSIKSSQGMQLMKCDMAGAAAVLGVMSEIRAFNPSHEVTAYIPVCENVIAGNAQKPGDVVRALNGKTIEVLNTDAEGRLILADALSLASKEKADTIIDLATLTGACVAALGEEYAGIFSNDNKLSNSIIDSGAGVGERFWALPLAPEYEEQLKSSVADLRNTAWTSGGAIFGALFLREFVGPKISWAHLDIAGPAFFESIKGAYPKGASGFGVRTLLAWLTR